jgi:hypothetical protein
MIMARAPKIERELYKLIAENSNQIQTGRQYEARSKTSKEVEDETRQEVAKNFVRYYFIILVAILVMVPIYNFLSVKFLQNTDLIIPLKDTILTYSAVVGPTVGLVVAYYFKNDHEA